ncbi:MAG: alpha/beta hydrolase [Myxococcota bacterium]|nr:alpha/beta hydrolase [Myxococcota bacterium]
MMQAPDHIETRRHGPVGSMVVVLHGGPGAPGSAGSLARALADPFHVLEPWQRWSSDRLLTVERHVEDLADVLARAAPQERPALVGESWGAMLGLVFAALHPDRISALALVGCGTFDERARATLEQTLDERTTPELRARLAKLDTTIPDAAERLREIHRLRDPLYTHRRAADVEDAIERFDAKGHIETWTDMLRRQESGVCPAEFSSIRCPVLMLHGAYDPHPGAMIRDGLAAHVPQLEYQEFERCGHRPWVEEHARRPFLDRLSTWLAEQGLQQGAHA